MPNVEESELIEEGALPPDDFHDYIERVRDVAKYDLVLPDDLKARLINECQNLLIEPETVISAAAALSVGHVVLQGPPGTGKSSFARALSRAFNCTLLPVTAHEDWSTFEVIGRQELRVDAEGNEQIVPVNGFFTEAVIRCAGNVVRHFDSPTEPQATWLLIDELNRAHADRAFGELFSVLGTDELIPIVLPHQPIGNRELISPRRFRILATINSIDKQFVNSLGQGLKRRFTFITLDIPSHRNANEEWGSQAAESSSASREYTVVCQKAVERVSSRIQTENGEAGGPNGPSALLVGAAGTTLKQLFDLVETVRYASADSLVPHLPIGTAQLIDTVELLLARSTYLPSEDIDYGELLDWAASVKLAPLFDTDTISPEQLRAFANGLPAPFTHSFKKEIDKIVAAGSYFVG